MKEPPRKESSKPFLLQIPRWIARLTAFLAASVGCSPRDQSAPPLRTTHWRGQETGYETTTTEPSQTPKPGAHPTP